MNISKKKGILIPFLFLIFFIAISIRPIKLTTDDSEEILFCWMWNKGMIEFTNSVTGGNVKILFDLKWGFNNFKMITDEKTENYYTSGTYSINNFLKNEKRKKLFFCSIVGMKIKIGKYSFVLKNSCATLEVLWLQIVF